MTNLALLVAAVLLYGMFVLGYALTMPWWRSWEGRALVLSSGGMTLLCGGLFIDAWRNVPNGVWLAIGIVVIAGGAFKVALLVRAWRAALRHDRDRTDG